MVERRTTNGQIRARRHMAGLAAMAGVVLLALGACATPPVDVGAQLATTDAADAAPTTLMTQAGPNASVAPGSTSLDKAIAATLRGLDPGVVQKATIDTMAGGNLTQLRVTVATPSDQHGDALLPEWEAALLAGAVAERLTASGDSINRTVGAYEYVAVTPDGKTVDQQGAALPPNAAGTHFPAAGLNDQQILEKIRSATDKQGWTLVSSRVLHPLDPAIVVTVRLPKGNKDHSEGYRLLGNAIRTLDYTYSADPDQCATAGYAIEVQDSTGKRVSISTLSCRAQAGSVWDLPGGPINVPHGGPPPAPYK